MELGKAITRTLLGAAATSLFAACATASPVTYDFTVNGGPTGPVPEPASLALVGVSLVGIAFINRRKGIAGARQLFGADLTAA